MSWTIHIDFSWISLVFLSRLFSLQDPIHSHLCGFIIHLHSVDHHLASIGYSWSWSYWRAGVSQNSRTGDVFIISYQGTWYHDVHLLLTGPTWSSGRERTVDVCRKHTGSQGKSVQCSHLEEFEQTSTLEYSLQPL